MADDSSPSLDSLIGNRARDEHGRFVSATPAEEPKDVKTEEPPKEAPKVDATPAVVTPPDATPAVVTPPVVAPVESEKEIAYKKAMQAEREKRQALQAELEALKQPKREPIDPWTDLPGALKQTQQDLEEKQFVRWCNLTANLERQKHADYDEMQAAFLEAAQADPSLFARLRNEDNPAEFAYKHGLLHRELGSVNGDPIAYRTKLESDIRAKLEAEYKAKLGEKPAAVPASLNSDNSPVAATPTYAGPPPLSQLLPPLATRTRR